MTKHRRLRRPPIVVARAPVNAVTVKPHRDAWSVAMALAKGDVSRVVVHGDGSVTVKNAPQRVHTQRRGED